MQLMSHRLMKLFAHDRLVLFGGAPEFEARVTPASFFVVTGEANFASLPLESVHRRSG